MERILSILVVDDDPDVTAAASAALEAAGHTVEVLHDSTKALARLEDKKPDVMLVDIMMPNLDGLELTKRVRAKSEYKDMKIVVVSGKAYEFDRKRAFDMGANGFVVKPIRIETFANEIERLIEDKVTLRYWGVRGTLPVPGARSLRYGGNTPCVTLEFINGRLLIFDAGSGIKELSNHLMKSGRPRLEAKIFISHPHWDHINALPFFVPLYLPGNEFEILGAAHPDRSMRELIAAQMEDVYFPVTIKEFGARVFFRDLRQESFSFGDIAVSTLLLSHPGYCLGYRIDYGGRSICYITDNELYLDDNPAFNPNYVKNLTSFIEGTDILITDCTYFDQEYKTKVGWGHSCISKVVELAAGAKVKSLHLFHHDPDQDDDAIDRKLDEAQSGLKTRGSAVECLAPAEGQSFTI